MTELYTYAAAQHWLLEVGPTARSYDAAGHTTAIGARTLHHDARGRLYQVDQNGLPQVRYGYNGVGEQVWRETLVGTPERTDFLYDTAGRLLGQYAATGQPHQQYLWMEDLPVGVVMEGRIYPVQADHLGTPRAVLDPDRGVVVWRWPLSGEGFGAEAPDEDPDGDGVGFRYDLRFSGQRYDALTGLHYNYFRDYDPETGRYIQSDPIGLNGGINTYAYALNNPLFWVDPLGLDPFLVGRPLNGSLGRLGFGHLFIVTDANYLGDPNANVSSFGQMTGGGTGPVDRFTKGLSAGTFKTDKGFWEGLGSKSCSVESPHVSLIPASDQTVRDVINSLIPNKIYAIGTINSNSASSAVANQAAGTSVPLPASGIYPGAPFNYTIRFRQ